MKHPQCEFHECQIAAARGAQHACQGGCGYAVMSLDEFRHAVATHDLTYAYSDDHRAWENGQREYARIESTYHAFRDSDDEVAEEYRSIWNENCLRKLRYPKGFLWLDGVSEAVAKDYQLLHAEIMKEPQWQRRNSQNPKSK